MPVNIDSICTAHFGAHYCLFYRSREDLVAFLTQYFARGMENGEYCMWVTADDEVERMARKELSAAVPDMSSTGKNKVRFIGVHDWYLKGGNFDTGRVCRSWGESLSSPDIKDSGGVRASGDLGWFNDSIWHNLMDYEARLNDIIPHNRFIAVCSYPLENLSASQLVDIIRRHQLTIVKDNGEWQVFNTVIPENPPRFLSQAPGMSALKLKKDIVFSHPLIYPEKCNGCGICVDVCQRGLLFMDNNKVFIRTDADCDWCGYCERVCTTAAISCPFAVV
jgi:NAD-dependent dihydropyrimidine dehydrogenase PreA subunit